MLVTMTKSKGQEGLFIQLERKTVPFTVKELLVLGMSQVAMVMVWRHVLARLNHEMKMQDRFLW